MTTDVVARPGLADLEARIERGLKTFVDVGLALLEIRDRRLYRETDATFEDYCRERWQFSDSRARQLVGAAETVTTVTVNGLPSPWTESQARELAPLARERPEAARDVWAEVVAEAEESGQTVTAAKVRRAVNEIRNPALYSSRTDEWETPQGLFDLLDAEFGFELDVCALDSSAKCERYFTPEDDGLAQEWAGICWMNPPYGDVIGAWVEKARRSAEDGATVVCLVPARTDTAWWWDNCIQGEVRFLRGRLKFGDAETGAPFPSAVVVFGRPAAVVWWDRG